MTRKTFKVLLAVLFAVFILGWGIKILEAELEKVFYWSEMAKNPGAMEAQVGSRSFLERVSAEEPIVSAKAALILYINNNGEEKILFEKNAQTLLPPASLTKLITALVVIDNLPFDTIVEVTEEAAAKPGNGEGKLKAGDRFRVGNLFNLMLVESNNTAALTLAQAIGEDAFVGLMNKKALELGLEETLFVNSTGLDPKDSPGINRSSSKDMAKIAAFILAKEPWIFETSLLKEFNLYTADGIFSYKAVNTNELLGKIDLIVGGKTGETPKSGGCLLLVVQAPKSKGYLISIVLNSPDRFKEMENLVDWAKHSYQW